MNSQRSASSCALSTGVYRYPFKEAAGIPVTTVRAFVRGSTPLARVIFCCFSHEDLSLYLELLATS